MKLWTFWKLEKSNKVANFYPTISAQETKQTNQQSNIRYLTFSHKNISCLIRSKNKKQNKANLYKKNKKQNQKMGGKRRNTNGSK